MTKKVKQVLDLPVGAIVAFFYDKDDNCAKRLLDTNEENIEKFWGSFKAEQLKMFDVPEFSKEYPKYYAVAEKEMECSYVYYRLDDKKRLVYLGEGWCVRKDNVYYSYDEVFREYIYSYLRHQILSGKHIPMNRGAVSSIIDSIRIETEDMTAQQLWDKSIAYDTEAFPDVLEEEVEVKLKSLIDEAMLPF